VTRSTCGGTRRSSPAGCCGCGPRCALPGLAWLELRLEPVDGDRTRFVQRALCAPHGLLGHAYWWAVAPFHAFIFGSMVRNIADAAVAAAPL
jgi:hypothetical protein